MFARVAMRFFPVCKLSKAMRERGGIHRADGLEDGERAVVTQQIARHVECRDALLSLQNLFSRTRNRHGVTSNFLLLETNKGGMRKWKSTVLGAREDDKDGTVVCQTLE
jgi:hypothetical protein